MNRFFYLLILLSACAGSKNSNTIHPFDGEQIGCGNFIAFKLSKDNKEYISIAFNAAQVELKSSQTYGIGKAEIIEVKWNAYDAAIDASLCNDIRSKLPKEISSQKANSGLVEIIVSDIEIEKAQRNEGYKVTILLRDVKFESTKIDFLKIDNIYIGWLPG